MFFVVKRHTLIIFSLVLAVSLGTAAYFSGIGEVGRWVSDPAYSADGVHLDTIPSKNAAHYVTKRSGGDGAYREAIDLILTAQGKMPALLSEIRTGWHMPKKAKLEIITSQEGIA